MAFVFEEKAVLRSVKKKGRAAAVLPTTLTSRGGEVESCRTGYPHRGRSFPAVAVQSTPRLRIRSTTKASVRATPNAPNVTGTQVGAQAEAHGERRAEDRRARGEGEGEAAARAPDRGLERRGSEVDLELLAGAGASRRSTASITRAARTRNRWT